MCICNGEAIGQNQKQLAESILCKASVSAKILIQMRSTFENYIEVYVPHEKEWISLSVLTSKIQTSDYDYSSFYEYLIELIFLLSDMCFDRNYLSIDFLQEVYSFKVC